MIIQTGVIRSLTRLHSSDSFSYFSVSNEKISVCCSFSVFMSCSGKQSPGGRADGCEAAAD